MLCEIRIAAVDGHPMFIEGLRRAFCARPEFKLVATGQTAADATRIAQELKPDVILLELSISGSGMTATKTISEKSKDVKVLVLTGLEDDVLVASAFDAGAIGFVTKGANVDEIAEAITSVNSGQPYITQSLASRLIVQKLKAVGPSPDDFAKLNYRETQVLERAARGMTNRDIADELTLNVRTIKNYMSRIFQKLHVRNRATAVARYTAVCAAPRWQ